ncbi:MAG: glycosyltransferase [Syntrophobacterales bacterium]|jgi:glycosyltransferase involved in cell wall biosynthesis
MNTDFDTLMSGSRQFVLHRNDTGIPPDRTIEVAETELSHLGDYPEVSIIIPTLDGYRNGLFPALLKQLSEQTYQNFEIIIIKADSRQGRAINTAADISRGKYILTLDDDTRLVTQDALQKLVEAMGKDETIGMAGGANVIPPDVPRFVRRAMQEIPRRSTPPVKKITDSDLAEHGLLMMRKDVFKTVGGENELLPRGLDPYLRHEFRKAGYRVIVVPGVEYSHLPPTTFFKLIKQFYRNGKSAGFCNRFFPQWIIETPDNHISDFNPRRPLFFRMARYPVNLVKKVLRGHWIYVTASLAYAAGFVWGYLIYRD